MMKWTDFKIYCLSLILAIGFINPALASKQATIDPNFPYGNAPQGNVCTSSTNAYSTPETMLGSWAMIQAVSTDILNGVLPSMFTESNVVYAVGTAAIGNQVGIPNCSGGCNQLNGHCFALQFNGSPAPNYPYMIFQSVNIGAGVNSFDIYMAGGGTGAFSQYCPTFWGTTNVNWAAHIENAQSCNAYFNNYQGFNSQYSVTYNGTVHPALTTLKNACTFASSAITGFNTKNWTNVAVVPVTCPKSLTQVTGLALPTTVTTVGNKTLINLANLTAQDFAKSTIAPATTTQMQDCKTPSSGYCGNVTASQPNYQASISASLTAPLLNSSGPPPTVGTLCVTVPAPSGYTNTALPTISAAGPNAYMINIAKFGTAACISNIATGVYTLTGSTLTNTTGEIFNPSSSPSAIVTQNATTNASVSYTKQPMGTLAVLVKGDSNCAISSTQTFNVTYISGSNNHVITVTGTTPASVSLPVGTYTISVTPATLPNNARCNATYNNNVSITANATVIETINYTYTPTASCAMTAQCSTWGITQDLSSGSSCNFAVSQPKLTNPSVITMTTLGITSITGAWNAKVTLSNGQVSAQLTNPVYVPSFGFNANGVITVPSSATLMTNGQIYTCSVVKIMK